MKSAPRVFVSYARVDLEQARLVRAELGRLGVTVLIDSADVAPGQNIAGWMNDAMETANHCLLLWSARAASRPWVTAEWHAALWRSVEEARNFLVVGMLDTHPLPAMLKPRLAIDLTTDLAGLGRLIQVLQRDRTAEVVSGQPVVGRPRIEPAGQDWRTLLYVTSEFWRRTLPVHAALDVPVALLTARIVDQLHLPEKRALDQEGTTVLAYTYSLASPDSGVLDPRATLTQEAIAEGDVLELHTTLRLGSPLESLEGSGAGHVATYRHDDLPGALRGAQAAALLKEDAVRADLCDPNGGGRADAES